MKVQTPDNSYEKSKLSEDDTILLILKNFKATFDDIEVRSGRYLGY